MPRSPAQKTTKTTINLLPNQPSRLVLDLTQPKKREQQYTNWMFTINNPKEDWNSHITTEICKQMVWQLEKGTNGTEHVQGYIRLQNKLRLTELKAILPGAHLEVRKGSHKQALAYVTKEETRIKGPFFVGEIEDYNQGKGKRTDLDECKTILDKTRNLNEVAQNQFGCFIKYYKGFDRYLNLSATKRTWKTQVIVLHGLTGTGKSFAASKLCGEGAYWYMPQEDGKWWDGYTGQETIVIDEFYGQIRWAQLLRLLDRHPVDVQTKGGTQSFIPKLIVITSNKSPQEWFNKEKCDYLTLARRLETIVEFHGLGHYSVQKGKDPFEPSFFSKLFEGSNEDAAMADSEIALEDLYCDEQLSEEEELPDDTTPPTSPFTFQFTSKTPTQSQSQQDEEAPVTPKISSPVFERPAIVSPIRKLKKTTRISPMDPTYRAKVDALAKAIEFGEDFDDEGYDFKLPQPERMPPEAKNEAFVKMINGSFLPLKRTSTDIYNENINQ